MAEPVGEDAWLAFVDEASRTAGDLGQRVEVVELYKLALAAEPWSLKLWLAYSEWFWSLHTDCQTADAGWPEEEQLVGKDVFALDTALDVWEEAARAIQYRLNDSHELWDRWLSIELEELAKSRNESHTKTAPPAEIERVHQIFLDRLQTPHSSWDDTSQKFSTFLSEYEEGAYESSMVEVTKLAARAKQLYALREAHELKLKNVKESGDLDAEKLVMKDYLDWEAKQARMKPKKGHDASPIILCIALYERALSSSPLAFDPAIWLDYIVLLGQHPQTPQEHSSLLQIIQRATIHCSSSGTLWARYITMAEAEGLSHEIIEGIKHAATNANLDRDGMGSVVEVYIAWCGYLLRRASSTGAAEEDHDLAQMGLTSALESVKDWGQKLHGKEYKGDPLFRIERLMIQYYSQKGEVENARAYWKQLVKTHAGSYEFWQQYYLWEMTVRLANGPPILATNVLLDSIKCRVLDWPEKMMEIYIRHCNIYADALSVVSALDTVHVFSKLTAERREKEAAAAALLYAQHNPIVDEPADDLQVSELAAGVKRKREAGTEETSSSSANKKFKSIEPVLDQEALKEQRQKRDRENTSVLVTGLPAGVTQTKVRQYFKDYGHVNSINVKLETDKVSSSALIEFRSNEDVQSALLRDGKYFADKQIKVVAASGFTLYVTNYPPTADDAYIYKLFQECGEVFNIRWPSLKFNPHRRFCYVTFKSHDEAARATKLHGQILPGGYQLSAEYSNPAGKKAREGAQAEGRELHVTSLDRSLIENDIKSVFSKYGSVETVRLLKTNSGESKGAGFIVFGKKEDAVAALALHETKLKSSIIKVEPSTGKNFKQTATTKGASASPVPDTNEDSANHTQSVNGIGKLEAKSTITLLNIPDTINDARIRVLAEEYGSTVKVVLHPKHQGAIIEYADSQTAGRAELGLNNYEISPGRMLRTGNLKDLFGEKEEIKTDRIQVGGGGKKKTQLASFIQPTAPIRRPGPGGKGGLGQKRGLGYANPKPSSSSAGAGNGEGNVAKSNADFKALFLKGET